MKISDTSIEAILEEANASKISNKRFKMQDIQKHLADKQVRWLAMHDGGKLVAVCGVIQEERMSYELDEVGQAKEARFLSTYVCQLSSLVSGKQHGRALLDSVLDRFSNIWLMAMPGTENFYRSVARLHEHAVLADGSKIFVKSDKFAQRICDLVGAV